MSKVAPHDVNSTNPINTAQWLLGFVRSLPKHTIGIVGFSLAVNLLLLVSPLYMLQIYDRILSSGSVDTLIWLSFIAVFLLGIYAAGEAGRRRILSLAGDRLEQIFAPRIFARFESGRDRNPGLPGDIANLSRLQGLLQNGTLLAFFDLLFTPLFILLLFFLDPLIGMLGIVGALAVFVVALISEYATKETGQRALAATQQAQGFAIGIARQRSAIVSMGLTSDLYDRWRQMRDSANQSALKAAKSDGSFSAVARALRQVLQVLVLGAGAALALSQQISPGGIVAGSVIMSRALAPIDQIVGGWRSIVMARAAWANLTERLDASLDPVDYTPLPKPSAIVKLDRLAVKAPGSDLALVRPFSLDIEPGMMIALVGANGSGKTTLLQTLAGAWPVESGAVILGGRNLHDWQGADRGPHIGYVPQDVELSPGSVAENISRFQADSLDEVFDAARSAGAHETILQLPNGYDTPIGPGGTHLSAGQRQVIGLARALFRHPVMLLLDEPTANLDEKARESVIAAIEARAAAGAIVFIATHDRNLIARMSLALVLRDGAIFSTQTKQPDKSNNIVAVAATRRAET